VTSCPKAKADKKKACKEALEASSRKKSVKRIRLRDIQEEVELETSIRSIGSQQSSCGDSPQSVQELVVGPMDTSTASDSELADRLKGKLNQTKVANDLLKKKGE